MSGLQQTVHNLMRSGRAADAEQLLISRLDSTQSEPVALELLMGLLISQQRWEQAHAVLDKVIASGQPDYLAHKLKGEICRAEGQLEAAVSHFQQAWGLEPNDGKLALAYAGVAPEESRAELLADVRCAIKSAPTDAANQSLLQFAAGKLADDNGDYSTAFEHYQQANQLSGRNTSIKHFADLVKASKKIFSKRFWKEFEGEGCADSLPVFIVGMPRTGTTLLEQRLARHPGIEGLGELPDISVMANSLAKTYRQKSIYPESVRLIRASHPREFGSRYVDRARSRMRRQAAVRVIDKNPLNFLYLGLIKLVLPQARIIHTRRNPIDTCLSCYFQPFGGAELGFTYSLESLASFYRLYRELMDFWSATPAGHFLEVDYHQLVDGPTETLKTCIEFMGLEWQGDVAQENAVATTIQTASHWQARQPVYRTSVDRWRHYEPHIEQLRQQLAKFL